ncbi:hypothetical protein EV368DRAFT_65414 [Lentinula lateritia]|nr:hypothetical protein EV368DRAFT_65414 [Lentinula lateritia]
MKYCVLMELDLRRTRGLQLSLSTGNTRVVGAGLEQVMLFFEGNAEKRGMMERWSTKSVVVYAGTPLYTGRRKVSRIPVVSTSAASEEFLRAPNGVRTFRIRAKTLIDDRPWPRVPELLENGRIIIIRRVEEAGTGVTERNRVRKMCGSAGKFGAVIAFNNAILSAEIPNDGVFYTWPTETEKRKYGESATVGDWSNVALSEGCVEAKERRFGFHAYPEPATGLGLLICRIQNDKRQPTRTRRTYVQGVVTSSREHNPGKTCATKKRICEKLKKV